MKKIAIVGSCVTRDMFNTKFIADYKEYFNIVAEHFQSSIMSLISSSAKFPNFNLNDYTPHEINWLKKEFSKSVWSELENSK